MARGLLGIEVANKIVRFIYLEKEGRDYRVVKAGVTERMLKPGKSTAKINDAAEGSLQKAIEHIIEQEQISPKRIFVSISRKDTVIHQVVLPKMPIGELDEVVSGEIEKIPVFYHRHFDFIYRSYPYTNEKNKVIFAALTRNVLDFVFDEVRKTRLHFRDMDIAPLNLKDILPMTKQSKHQHQAYIVIQEQNAYFAIFENNQYKMFYKSSMGLEHLTTAFSEEGKAHILASLIGELKRALKSYLSENKTAQVDLIWLAWDKTIVPDLDQKIASEFDIDVEVLYLKKFQNIRISQEQQLNPVYTTAITPILYYIRGMRAQFSLTHFFRNIQVTNYFIKTALAATIFVALIAATLSNMYFELSDKITQLDGKSFAISHEVKTLKKEAKQLFIKQNEYQQVRRRLLSQATYVKNLNMVSWSEVLSVVAKELPEELALTSFHFSESGRARIRGDAFQMESIAALIRTIDESAIMVGGKFDFLKEKEIEDIKIYNFGILAKLRNHKDNKDDKTGN